MNNLNVLVLGSDGMLGSMVFNYLKYNYPNNIFATNRRNKNVFTLRAESFRTDLTKILKDLKHIDYIINCIGITNKVKVENETIMFINSLFPLELGKFCEKHNIKVIHVSSDAVFSNINDKVTEKSKPDATELYGITKLIGESDSKNVLNIRTSIVGPNKEKSEGIWEWVKTSKETIKGFTNQNWAGCTSFQFAKLCEYIIYKSKFDDLRKKSKVYNFVPLGPTTKYQLVTSIAKTVNNKLKITKAISEAPTSRILASLFFDKKFLNTYTTNLDKAIIEADEFYEKI